jgi:hypothetical protein
MRTALKIYVDLNLNATIIHIILICLKINIYLNVNVQLPVDIYIFGRFSYSLDYNALTQVIETIYI